MRVKLRPWNKSRAGNVILFACLALFFGFVSVIVIHSLLAGDKEFLDWRYLLSIPIAAAFTWALYVTASPKHQSCMDAVRGEMPWSELKESVESEEYAEPLALGPYYDEDAAEWRETTYRMLISRSWMLLGQDMSGPLCVPKDRVIRAVVLRSAYERPGRGQPSSEALRLEFELANGRKCAAGDFAPERLGEVERMLREHFPGVAIWGVGQSKRMP